MVDVASFDRITRRPGFVSVGTGAAPDGNAIPSPGAGELAMDAARHRLRSVRGAAPTRLHCSQRQVVTWRSFSQGEPSDTRCARWWGQMDIEGFGECTNSASARMPAPRESRSQTSAHEREFSVLARGARVANAGSGSGTEPAVARRCSSSGRRRESGFPGSPASAPPCDHARGSHAPAHRPPPSATK